MSNKPITTNMRKVTAWAPVNVALVKYWGKKDTKLRLPANSSIAVCLKKLGTVTTVEYQAGLQEDTVVVDGSVVEGRAYNRVVKHLDRFRKLAKLDLKARVVSKNNFPKAVGLSASSSGFACLTLAASRAAGLDLEERELSRLARLASGSACRSIPNGWVEWEAGNGHQSSFAKKIYGRNYWDIRILVVLLSQIQKKVSSTDGHKLAYSSPFFKTRQEILRKNIKRLRGAISDKNFSKFGEIVEDEALSLHAIMLTSKPNLIYWLPETVRVMRAIQEWRNEGLEVYFTINTGQNVFVFCLPKDEKRLVNKLKNLEGVIEVKRDRVGNGARLIGEHLF